MSKSVLAQKDEVAETLEKREQNLRKTGAKWLTLND